MVGSNAFGATGADSTSTFSTALFFGDEDFFAFADVDLLIAFTLLTFPGAAGSALLLFATIKFLPELRFSEVDQSCNWASVGNPNNIWR